MTFNVILYTRKLRGYTIDPDMSQNCPHNKEMNNMSTQTETDINIAMDAIDAIITSMKTGDVTELAIAVDRLEDSIYQMSKNEYCVHIDIIKGYMRGSMQ